MKWHDYLIHYTFEKNDNLCTGNGCSQLSRKKKINSFEEVNSVIKYIQNNIDGATNIVIHNIMYLGRNSHAEY